VTDAYPPSQSSAAIQIRDLAIELNMQGVCPIVITATPELKQSFIIEDIDGIKILRLKTLVYKNTGKLRRAISEILMPFIMIKNFKKGGFNFLKWDAIVWYSPTIFLGPFIYYLKKNKTCLSYLILRDIFPAWAIDLGIIKKGFVYYLFRAFERFQYSVADCIGVQAFGNLKYFSKLNYGNVEVLQNWLSPKTVVKCSIDVSKLFKNNQRILVYAGNMGIAQAMGTLLDMAEVLLPRKDIGFLLVGWGSDMVFLEKNAKKRGLSNIIFQNKIPADEIPSLYSQCDVGLIALDQRHQTHNIPGKFLSYIQAGLPVLAIINDGNDLHSIINKYQVGRVTSNKNPFHLSDLVGSIVGELNQCDHRIDEKCKRLYKELFTTHAAAKQIINSLNKLI
jgi:glycosyltransferase involved in cell wall biosynthesis